MLELDDKARSIIEKEITEALSTYRTQFTLMIQIITVIILANVSLIGFAISSEKKSLFYLAALCPILVLFVRMKSGQLMLPIIYSAYHLEQKLGNRNVNWLATTFIAITFNRSYKLLQEIDKKETHEERIKALQRINKWYHYTLFSQSNLLITILCFATAVFEIFLSCIIK